MANRGAAAGKLTVAETFSSLREQGKTAFIPFITAGDPDLATTSKALKILNSCGSDVIEVGVPYSDPLADGPVIQASATRALKNGTTLNSVIEMLKGVTPELSCPIVLFTYYNPILKRGVGNFMATIKQAGIHGLVVPDLPLEETALLRSEAIMHNIELASGAAPPEHSAAVSSLPSVDVPHAAPLKPIGGTGSLVQNKLAGAPGGGSGPHVVQNADIPIKQTTSSSSREQSDDDDMEGDAETTGNANPVQQRLQRRKQSNRESARRSRSRKAAHLNELETQVAQLRVENSSLLRRLADVNQKFNEAAVDNRVLKADVETLRAKVKMAEDSVKRVTGMNALFPAVSDMSSLSMPFNGSPTDSTSDAAVPIQDDPNSYFANPSEIGGNNGYMPDIASSAQEDDNFVNGSAGKMGRTASLQRVASLEHLQKRMCGGPASSGSTS